VWRQVRFMTMQGYDFRLAPARYDRVVCRLSDHALGNLPMTIDPINQTPVNPPASDSTEKKHVHQKKYKKIRGWLIFLIVTLMFLTPGAGSQLLYQTNKAYREYVSRVPAPETLDTTLKIYKVSTRILMGLSFISGLLLLLRLRIGVTT